MRRTCNMILSILLAALMVFTSLPMQTAHAETLISTDKEAYEYGEPVMVTTNYHENKSWVGLYRVEDAIPDQGSIYWYNTTSNPQTQNILATDSSNGRLGELDAGGEFKVVLFRYEGSNAYVIVAQTTITIEGSGAAGEEYLRTDKDEYEIGEPIMVTASSPRAGAWVALLAIDDSIHLQSYWWYYVNGTEGDQTWANGETYNIYDTICNGKNGVDAPEKVLPGDYKLVLLYTVGTIHTLISEVYINIGGNLPNINHIHMSKEGAVPKYKYGEETLVTATSNNPNAFIGLYDYDPDLPNPYTKAYLPELTDGSIDLVAKAIAEGKTIEAGKQYRVYLFEPTSSNPYEIATYDDGSIVNTKFEILLTYYEDNDHIDWVIDKENKTATATFHRVDNNEASEPFTTDDVTVERLLEPACTEKGREKYTASLTFTEENALVTLHDTMTFTYTEEADVDPLGHSWGSWTTVTPATESTPGLEKHVCTRCGEEETREIPVVHDHVLIHRATVNPTCTEEGHREYWECSLCGKYFSDAEGTEEIDDKTSVIITALGHDWNEWTFDESTHTHSRTCKRDAAHTKTGNCVEKEPYYEDGKRVHECEVCGGKWYDIVLSTDKKEYKLWESIMVTTGSEYGGKDWVGLYKKSDRYGDSNPDSPYYDPKADKSIFWYYVDEQPNPADILRTRDENSRSGDYGPGEYTIYLFRDDAYNLVTSVDVTVTEESTEIGDYTLKLNDTVQTNGQHTDFTIGDTITVNAFIDGVTGSSWVGLYNTYVDITQDFSQFASTDWYYVRNHNGEDYSFPKLDTAIPGEYSVVLFGDNGHGDKRMAFTFKISKVIKNETILREPTCTRPGAKLVTYEDDTTENIPIPALGHDYAFDSWIWAEDFSAAKAHFICQRDESHTNDVDGTISEEELEDKIVYTAKAIFEDKEYTDVKEGPLPVPVTNDLIRLSGKDRYETSLKAADELKSILGVDKFDNVVLATGKNFADALGGGYLAAKKNAPILLTNDKNAPKINEYINANLKEGGTVYVLGGEGAVSEAALSGLKVTPLRLKGKDRYETNLTILNEAGVTNEDILICSGRNFADALAASASGRPMLLVDTKKNTLTDGQKEFLSAHTSNKLYILGGTGAVSETLEEAVKAYGTPQRVYGSSRYETSVEIAKTFFSSPNKALIAFSDDYPDGLCAGPLAYNLGAPILLTKPGKESSLKAYCTEASITSGYIIGGDARIPDASARDIFSLAEDAVIVKK